MRKTAALLTGDSFHTSDAKTAHGLVRGPSRFDVIAVIDRHSAGRDAGEVLDGRARGIPIVAELDALPRKPDYVVVGVATHGGVLPPAMRATLRAALERGISLVNGLHEALAEDPELVAAAARNGAELVDVRRPKPRRELHFWSGAIHRVRAPRIAVLGTDCALGKRTTCHVLQRACEARGLRAAIVHTGQTGWLQGIPHGFVLDCTPNDFVCGELEHAIVSCDRDLAPEVIFLEGQSALRNASGPCGSELLLAAAAHATVLQHAPARRYYDGQEALQAEIPHVHDEIELLRFYRTRVLGLTLNHTGLDNAQRESERARLERETGVPAVYPLLDGVERLIAPIREHLERERAR